MARVCYPQPAGAGLLIRRANTETVRCETQNIFGILVLTLGPYAGGSIVPCSSPDIRMHLLNPNVSRGYRVKSPVGSFEDLEGHNRIEP